MPNYYETLGVGPDAGPDVIQRVYRQLAKAYHPDTNPDNPAGAEKLKDLSEAYETLKDPAKRRLYDRALGLGAPGASRPRAPERDGAGRREAERAARRRADDERRAREEAGRRRQASERECRADEERRRSDVAGRAGGASGRTRVQAARERLRIRKAALARAIAYLAARELEDRLTTRVGFSLGWGWAAGTRCSIRGPEDGDLSLGPRDEILEVVLTGTSPELERLGGRAHADARLEGRLRAHARYLDDAGPAGGNPDSVRSSGARWLAEAERAFHAATWAAVCVACVRASEADLVGAVLDEERRQRRLRVVNSIRRWLRTPSSVGSDPTQRLPRARAALERHVRILRREYPAQIVLLQKAREPRLDGFFEHSLFVTHAAAECVARYVSAADGELAGIIDDRVATLVDVARSADVPQSVDSP